METVFKVIFYNIILLYFTLNYKNNIANFIIFKIDLYKL